MNYSLLFTLLLSIISQIGFSQKEFSIALKFSPNFEKNKLKSIRFDDGKKFHDVELNFIDNQLSIKDTFYGTYATIEIFYTDENNLNQPFQTGFFVSEKPAFVSFKKSKNKNPIANYKTKNAIELINTDYKQLKVFIAKEEKEAMDYINNLKNIEVTDSIMTIAQAKADKYLNKQTVFFKQCSGSYFCLWYFKNFIAVNATIPSDSLLTIFSNAFSDTMKSSFEANEIVKIINGRSEKNM